jgi:DNA-binding MarR family transcriptional regulator
MHHARMNESHVAPHTAPTILQLLETAASLERRLDKALSCTRGISFSEYRLLLALSTSANGLPRIDLANSVGLTASAVTRALKPLEKIGLVTTQKSERDARQSLAVISAAGQELLTDADGVLQDVFRQLSINKLGDNKVAEFQAQLVELKS